MKRALLYCILAACAAGLANTGCNGTQETNGTVKPAPDISKEELVETLNLNSDNVRSVISWTKIELKNADHPQGRDAEAVFAFMKPSTIGLLVSKAGQNIVVIKTNGEMFDVYDYEKQEGWTGKVEYLNNNSEEFFNFRPDFLSAAMALEHIDPEHAELGFTGDGDYELTITAPGKNKRILYINPGSLEPVRQKIFGEDGRVLVTVTYDEIKKVVVDGRGIEVKVPAAVTLKGGQEGAYLKISNADPSKFKVNDERGFWRAMGNSERVRFPKGAPVNKLQPDGTWRPGE